METQPDQPRRAPRERERPKPIRLTDAAAARVKEIMDGAEGRYIGVRIGVTNGGCAGMSYTMAYAEDIKPFEDVAEEKGVKVVIDPKAILFLIGIQELGDMREKFTKEQKQDLMHVAVCTLFSQSGYYELEKVDEDGWPHFKQLKPLPAMSLPEQENFMKDHVLLYFQTNGFIDHDQ